MDLARPGRALLAAACALLAVGCSSPAAVHVTVGGPVTVRETASRASAARVGATTAPAPAATGAGATPSATKTVPATPVQVVKLASVSNFRDVAGSGRGIRLADGTRMATGLVYRSGLLEGMSAADRAALADAGLETIYDLRTDDVAARHPDPEVAGAEYRLINVYAVFRQPREVLATPAAARRHAIERERAFVTDPAQRERIALVLTGIAQADGPVLIHCTEGKDRTGWVSALLQSLAGADRETVIAEYLASNRYRADLIEQKVAKTLRSEGATRAAAVRTAATVERSWLVAGLDAATARYGSIEGYLTEGLGLKESTLDRLRARLRGE
jgi:protein-tyrosine phosphatase